MRAAPISRGGFTAAEALVAVAIVAVVAAVFLPAVVGQSSKGEITALVTDLKVIASSIRKFNIDVQRWPKSVEDLVEKPSPFLDVNGAVVPAALAARWRGPYFDHPVDGELKTGFDALIQLDFLTRDLNGVRWVAARVEQIAIEEARKISAMIDNEEAVSDDDAGGTVRFVEEDDDRYMVVLLVPMGH